MKLLELEQQTAQARADLGKAQLKAEVPAEVQQRVELEKARLDKKGRERDLENLEAEGRVTQAARRRGARARCASSATGRAGRVKALEDAIERMTIKRARRTGSWSTETNWRDEKKKVGDSIWFGEVVLALPDLAEMRADGIVDEADGGPVRRGPDGHLRLEARPDLDFRGQGGAHRPHRASRSPGARRSRCFKVDVALERTDPTSCARPCASAARSRRGASRASCSSPARRSSCATAGRSCGRGAPWAGARCR